jgi:hypothetical protein
MKNESIHMEVSFGFILRLKGFLTSSRSLVLAHEVMYLTLRAVHSRLSPLIAASSFQLRKCLLQASTRVSNISIANA